jgi:hypothetical protein
MRFMGISFAFDIGEWGIGNSCEHRTVNGQANG